MADIKFRSFGPVPVHVVPIQSFSQYSHYFHYYFSRIMILFFQYKRRKRPWTISLRQLGYWRSKIKLRYELSYLYEWSNVTIFHKMDHLKWLKHTCRSSLLWMKIWSDILLLRLTKGKNMIDQSHNKNTQYHSETLCWGQDRKVHVNTSLGQPRPETPVPNPSTVDVYLRFKTILFGFHFEKCLCYTKTWCVKT